MAPEGVEREVDRPRPERARIRRGREATVRRLLVAAVGCWALAQLSVLGLGGVDAWPTIVAWTGAGVVVAGAARALSPRGRALAASVLVPACVLLVFEGGLFFLPSAVVLTTAAVVALPRGRRPAR